jgi:hypothetical protein
MKMWLQRIRGAVGIARAAQDQALTKGGGAPPELARARRELLGKVN